MTEWWDRPGRRVLPDHALLQVAEVMHYLRLPRHAVLRHVLEGDLRLTHDGSLVHRASVDALAERLRLERRGVVRPT